MNRLPFFVFLSMAFLLSQFFRSETSCSKCPQYKNCNNNITRPKKQRKFSEILQEESNASNIVHEAGNQIQKKKISTQVVVFVPTPVDWFERRKIRTNNFIKGNWSSNLIHLIYVFGLKNYNGDFTPVHDEFLQYANIPNIHHEITDCPDFGDNFNDISNPSSTSCKSYRAVKIAVQKFEFDYLWRGAEDAYINFKFFFTHVVPFIKDKKNIYFGRLRNPQFESHPIDIQLSNQPETQKLWKISQFGAYMGGMGFMISWNVANFMDSWTIQPHQTWCEDVVFGQWLLPFNIEWIDANAHEWTMNHRPEYNPGNCNSQLVVHYVQNQDWDNVDELGNLNFCK